MAYYQQMTEKISPEEQSLAVVCGVMIDSIEILVNTSQLGKKDFDRQLYRVSETFNLEML